MAAQQARTHLAHLLARGELELPLLPEVAGQVMALTADPEAEMSELAALIQRDQAMAGHLMRLVNSPLYGGRVPIVSLQQAVSRLGMVKIREISLLITCQSRVFKVKGFDEQVRALFRHSVAAASYAGEIAKIRRYKQEECFLAGLMHDVGKPVLLQALVDFRQGRDASMSDQDILELAQELHAEAGGTLAETWKLPERIVECVRFHHNPFDARFAQETVLTTALANELAHHTVGPREVGFEEVLQHPTVQALGLLPDDLSALMGRKEEVAESVAAIV